MTIFFIIISLLLNIASIMAIILLFMRQNKLFKVEENQRRTIREMEELMSAYLIEMKEENDRFLTQINKKSIEGKKIHENGLGKSEMPSITKNNMGGQNDISLRVGNVIGQQAVKAYQKQKPTENNQSSPNSKRHLEQRNEEQNLTNSTGKNPETLSLQDQILFMKKQGFSEGEIAKKLNKGKTEIELLLKFRENQQD